MKKIKWSYLLLMLLLISAHSVHADSPVWKVTKGKNQLFIGGTIHVLAKSDYPLPAEFEKAYKQSKIVVFETDLSGIKTPEFQKLFLSKMVYSNGESLKTVLKKDTFQKLENHFNSLKIPIEKMINFKVEMVGITLMMIELQRLGAADTGVDNFYHLKAINDGKELDELETVEEQLKFLSNMGYGQEDEFIIHTLADIKKLPQKMREIKKAWRKGDNQKMNEISLLPIKKDFPKVYDRLVVKRNNAWLPKIEAMLLTDEIELVLVGALHLVGDEGIINKLKAMGYDVQMM